jgi:hypothetical protein
MSNYLANHSETEKKTVMICDDARDLLEIFKPSNQNIMPTIPRYVCQSFNRDVVDRRLKCKVFKS